MDGQKESNKVNPTAPPPYAAEYPPGQPYPPPPSAAPAFTTQYNNYSSQQPQHQQPPPQYAASYPYSSYPPPQQQQQQHYATTAQSAVLAATSAAVPMPEMEANFSDKSIRMGFIKKVFALLTAMLLLTAGIMCLFMFIEGLREYARTHPWMYITSLIIYLGVVIGLICIGDTRRKFPVNIICLVIISVMMGVMLGTIAASFDVKEVLIAIGITILVTIGMMLLGFQKKVDFTWLSGILVVAMMCLIGFGLMCIIFQSEILYLFYASLGAFIFSLLIVVDVQLIVGGKHNQGIDPEEYILATLNLYLDIINLLLYILMIVAGSSN